MAVSLLACLAMGFPDHSADRSWLCLRTTDCRARALVQGVDRGVGMALEHKHYSNGGGLVDRPVEYRVESNGSVKRASNVPLMSDVLNVSEGKVCTITGRSPSI